MNTQSHISHPRLRSRPSRIDFGPPLKTIWAFMRGGLVPVLALTLSVIISIGLGVMAAEDWDGFAHRIDLGKTVAFYLSLSIGLWLSVRAIKQPESRVKRAQAFGLALILTLWLAFL